MSNTLYDQILKSTKPAKPIIRIDRSNLDTYLKCPLQAKAQIYAEIYERTGEGGMIGDDDKWWAQRLDYKASSPEFYRKVIDADLDRPAQVGIEFHRIMAEYIEEMLNSGEGKKPEALEQLALAGDPRFQPQLLHMAKLTGPRIYVDVGTHIASEQQFGYTIDNMGPRGESVALSCRPDWVCRGYGPGEIRMPDWKTGWGRDFGLQSPFYAVVASKFLSDIQQVTWQPFYCRQGSWGKPDVYDEKGLADAENIIKAAAVRMLGETDWNPTPGVERCRYCRIKGVCTAEKRYGEIDKDREGFARGTEKLQAEVADRIKVMKADFQANGPIQVDGHKWEVNPISQRPQFKITKAGQSSCIGEDDEPANAAHEE